MLAPWWSPAREGSTARRCTSTPTWPPWPGPQQTRRPPSCEKRSGSGARPTPCSRRGTRSSNSYAVLVEETADVPWAETVVFHMDEYVGVGPDHPAGFQRWIRERIVIPTRPKAAHYLEGRADPAAECSRYAALLAALPLDLCCLGIGENAHLAFNDPPVADFNDPLDVKVVELDAACRHQQVNEGHFPDLDSVPTQAVTVTIPALLRARPRARGRARIAQGGSGPRRPHRSGRHHLSRFGPAHDRACQYPPRTRVGTTAPGLTSPTARQACCSGYACPDESDVIDLA